MEQPRRRLLYQVSSHKLPTMSPASPRKVEERKLILLKSPSATDMGYQITKFEDDLQAQIRLNI